MILRGKHLGGSLPPNSRAGLSKAQMFLSSYAESLELAVRARNAVENVIGEYFPAYQGRTVTGLEYRGREAHSTAPM